MRHPDSENGIIGGRYICVHISSVYSLFSDRAGLPPHNMHGMKYQIVLNITFWPELN